MKKKLCVFLAVLFLSAPTYGRAPEGSLLAGVRPGPDGRIDVLTVFAHQDDESIFAGGTLLKLKEDPRVRLHMLCLTLGDLSAAMDKLGITSRHQGEIRTEELKTAAAVYRADEVIQFEYRDKGLQDADHEELVSRVAGVMERTGAEVVITHDPAGVTGHPDHRACCRATTEAFGKSSAQKLYYVTVAPWLYAVIYGGGPDYARPTIRVDISEQLKLKRLAMYSHATQKHFSAVGPAMDVMGLFRHEYFALARRVDHPE